MKSGYKEVNIPWSFLFSVFAPGWEETKGVGLAALCGHGCALGLGAREALLRVSPAGRGRAPCLDRPGEPQSAVLTAPAECSPYPDLP